jgi:PAS domain S-box-containing protein
VQHRTIELLRSSEKRYRLLADHVTDIIWTVSLRLSDAEKAIAKHNVAEAVDTMLERWRFTYISPAVEHVLGYTPDESMRLAFRDIAPKETLEQIRAAIIDAFTQAAISSEDASPPRSIELRFLAKDGTSRWCEVVGTYVYNADGMPEGLLGITRDVSQRHQAEHALRESERKLRTLFENLPDLVVIVDRAGRIQFANRSVPEMDREQLRNLDAFSMILPEHRAVGRRVLDQTLNSRETQSEEVQDIFGHWWSCRLVSMAENGQSDCVMVICTNVTQERLAAESVQKEQKLLRRLLELHERERQLTAYDIHDGFAQQLTGALFQLQGFRNIFVHNPDAAWKNHDTAITLLARAIDETRRLISGLRPPILDESGIVQAIEYLVYEHEKHGGPKIEFVHEVALERFAPPLESAVFRIVQESLQNACRHSRSEKIRIFLVQKDDRIHIDVQDWGIGFSVDKVAEQRFGLQGIRERVRLLDGRITIDTSPAKGTHIHVDLPLVDNAGVQPVAECDDRDDVFVK